MTSPAVLGPDFGGTKIAAAVPFPPELVPAREALGRSARTQLRKGLSG